MLSSLKNLVKNHWKKVVIGGAAVQGLAYGAKYAADRFLEYHKADTLDLWEKMKREQHFETLENNFRNSFLALAANLRETVLKTLDAEALTLELKTRLEEGTLDARTKLELWDRLKLIGFARILVIVYATSLLNILLRIQLNIIGGYLFVESQDSERKHEWRNVDGIILTNNTAIDADLKKTYLALASYLVTSGTKQLCDFIYDKTAAVIGSIGLKQKLTITDLQKLLLQIASKLDQEFGQNGEPLENTGMCPVRYPWKYVFPDQILEDHNNFRNTGGKCRPHYEPPDMYDRLLSETYDLLDSDDVTGLLATFEKKGISHFCDRVADYVMIESELSSPVGNTAGSTESSVAIESPSQPHQIFSEVAIPMAKIIPKLNELVNQGLGNNDPWLSVLSTSEATRNLAANVYESFSTAPMD